MILFDIYIEFIFQRKNSRNGDLVKEGIIFVILEFLKKKDKNQKELIAKTIIQENFTDGKGPESTYWKYTKYLEKLIQNN